MRGHEFYSSSSNNNNISSRMAMMMNSIPDEHGDRTIITTSKSSLSSFVDPYSDQAKHELSTFYSHHNLPVDDIDSVHKSLLRLTECVISWNEKLNLVSRKECTPIDVYHKHVMPSVALLPLLVLPSSTVSSSEEVQQQQRNEEDGGREMKKNPSLRVVDIGTGGGFPGLPLALLLPNHQFTLVDSIRKKLVAVSDMASELGVTNVRIHCGRAEEMKQGHTGMYHVVLGRSVTALPNFCSWIYGLLKREEGGNKNNSGIEKGGGGGGGGRLIYIIGGDIDEMVQSKVISDIPIDTLLQRPMDTSDKRALIFSTQGVRDIAREFLGTKREEEDRMAGNSRRRNSNNAPVRNNGSRNNNSMMMDGRGGPDKRGGSAAGRSKKPARGAWSEKRNDGVAKQRGFDDFQRFESSSK